MCEKAIADTGFVSYLNVSTHSPEPPFYTSHNLTTESAPEVASKVPRGLNLRQVASFPSNMFS